jgi:hypothetical protein
MRRRQGRSLEGRVCSGSTVCAIARSRRESFFSNSSNALARTTAALPCGRKPDGSARCKLKGWRTDTSLRSGGGTLGNGRQNSKGSDGSNRFYRGLGRQTSHCAFGAWHCTFVPQIRRRHDSSSVEAFRIRRSLFRFRLYSGPPSNFGSPVFGGSLPLRLRL